MKIIIGIDQLVQRDLSTAMLESLLSLDADIEILTLMHAPGEILGPINTHKVHSSFLTLFRSFIGTNIFKYSKAKVRFLEKIATFFKVPEADAYIFITKGYLNFLKTPATKLRVDYIYSDFIADKINFQDRKLCFSSKSLEDKYGQATQVIPPPFISRDFPQILNEQSRGQLIFKVPEASIEVIEKFLSFSKDRILVFMVEQEVSSKVRVKFPEILFVPILQRAEFYSELVKSTMFIDLTFSDHFPEHAFGALCSGVNVICYPSMVNLEFMNSEVCHYVESDHDLLRSISNNLLEQNRIDPKLLRRYALRFNERVFKNSFRKLLFF
jgi:hypothetical protein